MHCPARTQGPLSPQGDPQGGPSASSGSGQQCWHQGFQSRVAEVRSSRETTEGNNYQGCQNGASLSFHSLLFLFYQGKTSNLPRIFSHCRTHKILGKDRKYQNNQGNSLLKINQGNPKNQGMEGQGFGKRSFCRGDTRHFRHFRRFLGFEEQNPCFCG